MPAMVERYNSFTRQRYDMFGFADIVAVGKNKIIAVQSCGQAFSEHNKKILNEPMAKEWLKAGGGIILIGWRKIKLKRGGKALRWKPRIKEYSLENFSGLPDGDSV